MSGKVLAQVFILLAILVGINRSIEADLEKKCDWDMESEPKQNWLDNIKKMKAEQE